MFASPLARRLAAEQGIDLNQLARTKSGTGIAGMFRSTDLAGVVATDTTIGGGPMASAGYHDVPLSNMRAVSPTEMCVSDTGSEL